MILKAAERSVRRQTAPSAPETTAAISILIVLNGKTSIHRPEARPERQRWGSAPTPPRPRRAPLTAGWCGSPAGAMRPQSRCSGRLTISTSRPQALAATAAAGLACSAARPIFDALQGPILLLGPPLCLALQTACRAAVEPWCSPRPLNGP